MADAALGLDLTKFSLSFVLNIPPLRTCTCGLIAIGAMLLVLHNSPVSGIDLIVYIMCSGMQLHYLCLAMALHIPVKMGCSLASTYKYNLHGL